MVEPHTLHVGWATGSLQERLEGQVQAKKSYSYSSTAFVLKQRSWLRLWDYLTVSSSLTLFRTQTQRTETCPHISFLLQMETTLWHQMSLDGKTIKGFKQGVMCSNCTLKAISLASVQDKGCTVTSRSRETSSENREGRRVVVSTERRGDFDF